MGGDLSGRSRWLVDDHLTLILVQQLPLSCTACILVWNVGPCCVAESSHEGRNDRKHEGKAKY